MDFYANYSSMKLILKRHCDSWNVGNGGNECKIPSDWDESHSESNRNGGRSVQWQYVVAGGVASNDRLRDSVRRTGGTGKAFCFARRLTKKNSNEKWLGNIWESQLCTFGGKIDFKQENFILYTSRTTEDRTQWTWDSYLEILSTGKRFLELFK